MLFFSPFMLLPDIILYSIPSFLFYLCTEKHQQYTPDIVLVFITIIQLLIPISYRGAGLWKENDFFVALSISLGSRMMFYIHDLRQCGNNQEKRQQLAVFYQARHQWNESPTRSSNNHKDTTSSNGEDNAITRMTASTTTSTPSSSLNDVKPVSLSVIYHDSRRWFLKYVTYIALLVPIMSFFDGLLHVCSFPPTANSILYWYPWKTLAYYLVTFLIVHPYLHAVDLIYRFFLSAHLMMMVLWTKTKPTKDCMTSLLHHYHDSRHYILQPSLFDQPWLAHSAHNLWSCRWHQLLRPGFKKLVYDPVRSLFPEEKANNTSIMGVCMGRIAAIMAVFLASGLLHDYILLARVGLSAIRSYPGMLGQQTIFFLLQGVATVISSPCMPWYRFLSRAVPMWLARLLTLVWFVFTLPIFIVPFSRNGSLLLPGTGLYPRFFDSHIGFLCPYGTIDTSS
ncbi:uncharacterized protein BX664DRAFT_338878 [Halteromyces radiatus]|uniref:uncharacterized protein n=1 Tax=Halteromyces radiatus TaxID=101107 RepID=UPI00221EA0B1|nr:uncharacterized protein BX664DRAFT_338878 [Halteromyces radiatus]KAI8082699.1 hypothetical protein BX664DRAFT_338878 [Halteromyces radiatus]